jgi:predicted glycosyltransferase
VSDRVRYCGYVCTPQTARYPARARAKYISSADTGTKLIVAMAGGGADAYPMMRALLDALPTISTHQSCFLALIAGPFMPAEQRRDLEARARGLPARVSVSVSDPLSYIDAADLVIAMAGYNTTMEILRSNTRAILIPRAGPSAEQRMRARLFAARGWVEMIDPDDLNVGHVAATLLANLSRGPEAAALTRPDIRGLNVAANQLLDLLPSIEDMSEDGMSVLIEPRDQRARLPVAA